MQKAEAVDETLGGDLVGALGGNDPRRGELLFDLPAQGGRLPRVGDIINLEHGQFDLKISFDWEDRFRTQIGPGRRIGIKTDRGVAVLFGDFQ